MSDTIREHIIAAYMIRLASWSNTSYLRLSFAESGYTSCVAGDIGKTVIGGVTGDTGTLIFYDNLNRNWIVNADTAEDIFDDDDEAITITTGTGAGNLDAVGEAFIDFNYNCGSSAERAIPVIQEKDLPACVLWPQKETSQQIRYSHNLIEMPVKLEALVSVEIGVNNSVIKEKLLGDAIKIMTDPSVTVTSLINSIFYTGGGSDWVEKGEEQTAAISANFLITYKTALGNPYSQ